jgi:hypothetical protein
MIDVLCPVLGRPANAAPFADSLAAATESEFRLLFLCNPRDLDEIAACQKTYAEIVTVPWGPGRADFAKKINYAFALTDSEWVFQAADDVRFGKRWDAEAIAIGRKLNAAVVGTNDLHNPLVRRGRASTHTLFRRDYIETQGGTVDATGAVFCELYDHQWCDSEFVETARLRRQFAFAQRSIVEHFHPHWGNAEMDATYEKATRSTAKDMRLYQQRMGIVRKRTSRTSRTSSRRP